MLIKIWHLGILAASVFSLPVYAATPTPAAASPIVAETPFPLGVYVGGPNGNNSSAEAAFETSLGQFETQMGATPKFIDTFVDYTQGGWSLISSSAQWGAWSLAQCKPCKGMIPVVSVPMLTTSDWGIQKQSFKDVAAGLHDDVWTNIVRAYANNGFKTIYARIGVEYDANYFPWGIAYAASPSDWVAAFQHIASVMHAVPGVTVKVVWNPTAINWDTINIENTYPGDNYVDVVACDPYSPVYPRDLTLWNADGTSSGSLTMSTANIALWAAGTTNREHFWSYENAVKSYPTGQPSVGINVMDIINIAKTHNKPFALAETGAGGNDGVLGPKDDPAFPTWLANTLHETGVQVEFAMIWDVTVGDGNWRFTGTDNPKPLEAASWKQNFGALTQQNCGLHPSGSQYSVPTSYLSGRLATTTECLYGGEVATRVTKTQTYSCENGVTTLSGVTTASSDYARPLCTAPFALLYLADDPAYGTHAKAAILVDGVQIGIYTISVTISSDRVQIINIPLGSASKTHTIQVEFLNDSASETGTPKQTRKLYINGYQYKQQNYYRPHVMTADGFYTVLTTPAQ